MAYHANFAVRPPLFRICPQKPQKTNVPQHEIRTTINNALHDIDIARVDRFFHSKRADQAMSQHTFDCAEIERKIEAAEYWEERDAYMREKQRMGPRAAVDRALLAEEIKFRDESLREMEDMVERLKLGLRAMEKKLNREREMEKGVAQLDISDD